MLDDRNKILTDSLKRLLRRGATTHLAKIVNKTHATDLAVTFRSLSRTNQRKLLNLIHDIEKKGTLLMELDEDILVDLFEGMDVDEIVKIFDALPKDDVAGLLSSLPEEKSDAVLKKMKGEGVEEIEDLLKYGDETAGRIMVSDLIALKQDMTAKEAIEQIQKEHHEVEMPFYLYVVDEYGKLVGVSSLRQLVLVSPETPLKEFMTTDVVSVETSVDQEEVAKLVAQYDILAVPVVDEGHRLVGIVTVDDVIDVFRREATEDILKMAGAGEEFVETKSVMKSTRIRLPWLFASCVGGIFASVIIGYFSGILSKMVYLAAFIPVIAGMGGNVGTQSSTIVVRGLATGRINIRDIFKVVLKELSTGVILGIIYGLIVGLVAEFRYSTGALALSVGLALMCSMSVAALMGALLPMVFARVRIDPAVATGPFVTTATDIISIFFYFQIATTLLNI
ncbi:MAG: magnesium transporter [Pseudomonadota bacterium]